MKLALAQMEVHAGQPKKNLETMLHMIEQAKKEKVDLIAFPEMCMGGYLVGDKWNNDTFCQDLMEYNEDIRKASDGIAVAFGNIYLDSQQDINQRVGDDTIHPNKDGRTRKYNAVYVYQNGKPAQRVKETNILPPGVHPKTLLPNYRFFDDERYFFSLEDIAKDFGTTLEDLAQPFLIDVKEKDSTGKIINKKVPIGFTVCEDLWCEDYRRNGQAQNITKILIENGAKEIVSISASPWTFGKNDARDRRIEFLKQDSGDSFVPFHYVNCTGAQNNGKNIITFDGSSTSYDTKGKPKVLGQAHYQEELIIMETDTLDKLPVAERVEKPRIAQKLDALIKGLRHFGDNLWVNGMSGGIDSAVSSALLTLAFGKEKVLGVTMPWTYTSKATLDSAHHVAAKLGIPLLTVPIGEFADLNASLLENMDLAGEKKKLSALQQGNVAAKIRGTTILSNIAAQYHARFPSNGNKLEAGIGYVTLYGDQNGALAPLADLLKTEIFELARYLNDEVFHDEVIPRTLIPDELCRFTKDQIQPSAELEKDQIDPMKFGYHDALLSMYTDYKPKTAVDILRSYRNGTLHQKIAAELGKEPEFGLALMKRWGIDNPKNFVEDLDWFDAKVDWSVFKRIQQCPIIVTSKTAWGYDRRESILPYQQMKEQIRLKESIVREMEKYIPLRDA